MGLAPRWTNFTLGERQGDRVEMREVTLGEAFVSESQNSQIGNLATGKLNLQGRDAESSAA